MTPAEQKLVLETKITERALIVYVIQTALDDEDFHEEYQLALKDEIQNHNLAIEEYKEELKKLNP
jgi:hypothetical protein